MKSLIIILLFLGIIISGCVENPTKEVPVVKVNITFEEKNGIVEAESYKLPPGTVSYLSRPRTTQADKFPAIGARTTILKGENSTIGPWEMVPYKGNGTYSFNIGFEENHYPVPNDTIHVSIMVVDKNGGRIGYVIENIKWK